MKRLVAFVGLVLLVGCQAPPAEMTEAEKEAIAGEILQVMQESYEAAAANDDFEGMMASWSGDPSAYFVGEPAMYLSRMMLLTDVEAIRAYWEPSTQTRGGTNLLPSDEYVAVLSPDAALHVFVGDWSVLNLEGGVSSEGRMSATTLFVRENGEWKQLHYHQSFDRAEPEVDTGG